MESILTSIKKLLGVNEDCTDFDTDIIMHINAVFSGLKQMGAGPKEGFFIRDKYPVWTDYIPKTAKNLEMIKTYVYLKVKLLFDPPTIASVLESYKALVTEYEWRITAESDAGGVYENH
jgi:hypothetical protein